MTQRLKPVNEQIIEDTFEINGQNGLERQPVFTLSDRQSRTRRS